MYRRKKNSINIETNIFPISSENITSNKSTSISFLKTTVKPILTNSSKSIFNNTITPINNFIQSFIPLNKKYCITRLYNNEFFNVFDSFKYIINECNDIENNDIYKYKKDLVNYIKSTNTNLRYSDNKTIQNFFNVILENYLDIYDLDNTSASEKENIITCINFWYNRLNDLINLIINISKSISINSKFDFNNNIIFNYRIKETPLVLNINYYQVNKTIKKEIKKIIIPSNITNDNDIFFVELY